MRNSRRGEVDAFIVMDVMEAARQAEEAGRRIVHMEVGQPGTGAPQAARHALAEALEAGPLGYTVSLGLPALRERIAQLYDEWHGLQIDPSRIVVTAGASGAFILAFSALFDTGDRVGLGLPCYPSYRQILSALDITPVGIRTRAETRFQPRPADLEGRDLQGLLVASPANPTGTMLDKSELAALAEACSSRDIALISDEIYHGLSYDRPAVTALSVTDEVYVVNSFSKYFSMTGWRVGWMVVPEDHVRRVERLAQNMFICPPHASQVTALAAMECEDELEENVARYARNRARLLSGLPRAGFDRLAPADGAFYVYADVSHLTNDSRAFAAEILAEADVAVTPGLDFDPEEGLQTLRFSYAGPEEDMDLGLERLEGFMRRRGSLG